MNDPLRVIIEDEPGRGAWNMAIDEVLLETALATGQSTLRWYRWKQPTLSLGHFQPEDDPTIDERFASLPKVRRLSGGGAILHDREWTYSVSFGPGHPLAESPGQLYVQVHETVIGVLEKFGVPAQLRGQADESLDHHFLCFSRGDANDVIISGHKVLGSAQRRRRASVLQHGALLLRASPYAPEFPGVMDLASTVLNESQLFDALTRSVAETLAPGWYLGTWDDAEMRRADDLMTCKYAGLDRNSAESTSL